MGQQVDTIGAGGVMVSLAQRDDLASRPFTRLANGYHVALVIGIVTRIQTGCPYICGQLIESRRQSLRCQEHNIRRW